jgi:hypothetical protein
LRIEWFGLERDPAIIERAFDVGIQALSLLAPRR